MSMQIFDVVCYENDFKFRKFNKNSLLAQTEITSFFETSAKNFQRVVLVEKEKIKKNVKEMSFFGLSYGKNYGLVEFKITLKIGTALTCIQYIHRYTHFV